MEEIVKGLLAIFKEYGGYGLFLFLFIATVWVLVRILLKEMKQREELIEKFFTLTVHNKKSMDDMQNGFAQLRTSHEELNTDVHDLMQSLENEREIQKRVSDELQKRGPGHGRNAH